MRFLSGLAMLLLTMSAHALPSQGVVIHLSGQHTEEGVALEWEVHGGQLTRLDLLRIEANGTVAVIPLDPTTRAYLDTEVVASDEPTYILFAEFDGGVTTSNAYDSGCPYAGVRRDPPDVYVQPECIPESRISAT